MLLLLLLATLATTATALIADSATLQGVNFGSMELQTRSGSSTSPNEFLYSVLTQTQSFLDQALLAEYTGTGYIFSRVVLAVSSYQMDERAHKKNATNYSNATVIDASAILLGTAMFDTNGSIPNPDQVTLVVKKVFQEQSGVFLGLLTSASNALLHDISFALVTVNNGASIAQQGGGAQGNNNNSSNSAVVLAPWMIGLIAGAGTFLFVLSICLLFICCTRSNWASSSAAPRSSKISLEQQVVTKKQTHDTDEDAGDDLEGGHPKYAPRYQTNRVQPSPMQSDNASQGSSAFSYNRVAPVTVASSKPATSFQADTSSEDAETWNRASTINNSLGAFGHDISAISNKRDLSLIEEETMHDEHSSACLNNSAITIVSAAALEKMEARGGGLLIKRLDLNGSAQNVIEDLNDLSMQVSHFRGASPDRFLASEA
jgi:hypothetical protein